MAASSGIIILHLFLICQCFHASSSRTIISELQILPTNNNILTTTFDKSINTKKEFHGMSLNGHSSSSSNMDHQMDLAMNLFFTINDLKPGNNMSVYFSIKNPLNSPHFIPKEEADSIPFSSAQLPYLLNYFSFSEESPQAKAMGETLKHCESKPLEGETKFCATSLESMLDSAGAVFGSNTRLKVLTTNHLTKPRVELQNYTISGRVKEVSARKIVACHSLPYPYVVFYCHSQESDHKLLKVLLVGDDGGRVEAPAMCHMNTSQWDPSHLAFRALKTKPGESSVCHFFPADNLIWVPSSSALK
ncbi:hypothetical protein Leryth_004352 [Lithospermum erythrorhizon]|nr:hypothetical protein Leryth_004352 [Lithospermum erythrorhizon]